jgi:hypothetical protein
MADPRIRSAVPSRNLHPKQGSSMGELWNKSELELHLFWVSNTLVQGSVNMVLHQTRNGDRHDSCFV